MVKILNSLLLLFILSAMVSCHKLEDENNNWLNVQGALVAGEPVSISVFNQQGGTVEIEKALLINEFGNIELSYNPTTQKLVSSASQLIIENTAYILQIETAQRTITSSVKTPPQIEVTQVSAQTIPIDESSEGQPIFSIIWSRSDDVSQIMNLVEVGVSNEIPFAVPSGQFLITNGAPVSGQGATLYDTDFVQYGLHSLEVYAVPKEYESVFFYRPEPEVGQVDQGPDNIWNGSGFIVGASKVEVSINLIEML